MQFQDLIYEVRNGVAWIIINRQEKMNSFRGTTCDELIKALYKAGYDKSVGAIVLAGAGDRAFCIHHNRPDPVQALLPTNRVGVRWSPGSTLLLSVVRCSQNMHRIMVYTHDLRQV